MNRKLLTIVITSFNRIDFLLECLASLEDEVFPELEIVLVDHGSSDGTEQLFKNLTGKGIKCLKILNNLGTPSCPRNFGASNSNGMYLIFLDSDDLIFPELITTYLNIIKSRSPILIYSNAKTFGGELEIVLPSKNHLEYRFGARGLVWGNYIPLLTAAVRRDIHFKIGGWDESLEMCGIEDYDYFFRASLEKGDFCYIPKVLAKYRVHVNSLSSNKARERVLILKVLKKIFLRKISLGPFLLLAALKHLLVLSFMQFRKL